MIQVLIRSKRTLTAELLSAAVCAHSNFKLIQLVQTDEELSQALDIRPLHVVLFIADAAAGEGWLESIRSIRDAAPQSRIILLSEARDPNLVITAFRAGIRGFFSLRDSSLELLCRCIERVHDGQIWANSQELEWLLEALECADPLSKPLRVVNASGERLLSSREEDVVKLLREGLQNREIARALNLSEHTIKNYLFRIYDKLGISSRTELLLYVMTPSYNEVQVRKVG